MRHPAGFALGLAMTSLASAAQATVGLPAAAPRNIPAVTEVEYFCSPGFEPSYRGTCVAVAPRAEIELFVDQPLYEAPAPVQRTVVRHRRRHVVRERY